MVEETCNPPYDWSCGFHRRLSSWSIGAMPSAPSSGVGYGSESCELRYEY